jgi:hypothetical protein
MHLGQTQVVFVARAKGVADAPAGVHLEESECCPKGFYRRATVRPAIQFRSVPRLRLASCVSSPAVGGARAASPEEGGAGEREAGKATGDRNEVMTATERGWVHHSGLLGSGACASYRSQTPRR